MEKKNVSELKKGDFERLGNTISELTCKGLFWGKGLGLALEKERLGILSQYNLEFFTKIKPNYENHDFLVSIISAASSTYYAASGNALSHLGQGQVGLFSWPLWFWRAWRCLRKAEKYSDEFAKLKPMEDMSLGELDVRACVLNKVGRLSEALNLLSHGIMRILTKQIGTKHDLCLFLIHEAEIYGKMKKMGEAEDSYTKAIQLLENNVLPELTKVRVLKSYGKFLAENKRIDEAESVLGDALDLARENGLYDQKIKIKEIFKKFKLVIR